MWGRNLRPSATSLNDLTSLNVCPLMLSADTTSLDAQMEQDEPPRVAAVFQVIFDQKVGYVNRDMQSMEVD